MILRPDGIAFRIALAALAVALLAVVIMAVGVLVLGSQSFADLMVEIGESTESSRQMFTDSVGWVVVGTIGIATVASFLLATILGAHLARPLREIGRAARRLADGDYAARTPRYGPEEITSLSDSVNQMAAALGEHERMRREFIANAAHELRTPLTNLQGYLEALRDGVIEPDRSIFESLWDEAERLVRLSRSLDTLAAGDAGTTPGTPIDLDLTEAIRSAVDLVRPGILAGDHPLMVDVPSGLRARADPDQLAQVLANLLQNAIRYTPAGGQIAVRAERRPGDLLVSIANSGDVPEEDLPHVFERFYRVEKSRDRERGGAGIGLAIVRQLVEAAGGRVGVESSNGLTTFWFSVPSTRGTM